MLGWEGRLLLYWVRKVRMACTGLGGQVCPILSYESKHALCLVRKVSMTYIKRRQECPILGYQGTYVSYCVRKANISYTVLGRQACPISYQESKFVLSCALKVCSVSDEDDKYVLRWVRIQLVSPLSPVNHRGLHQGYVLYCVRKEKCVLYIVMAL